MLCTSQASTAICMTMDEPSSSSSSIQLGGRAIDRHNPIIRDQKRLPIGGGLPAAPCSSSSRSPPPIDPMKTSTRPNNINDPKAKKSSSSSSNKPKSSFDKSTSGSFKPLEYHRLVAPPPRDSSRYLLSETAFFDYDPVFTMVPAQAEPIKITSTTTTTTQALTNAIANEQASSKPSSSPSSTSSDQIDLIVSGGGAEGVPALQRL